MAVPTTKQIQEVASKLSITLGGSVHVSASRLAESVDCEFPDISDEDFEFVKQSCSVVAEQVRFSALEKMWADSE